MYQRRLAYNNKKRKYPYSKKSYTGRSKYRKSNNASSYFTYDAPRAKSISRLNAALGAELKQYYHETNISADKISAAEWIHGAKYNSAFEPDATTVPTLAVLPRIRQGQTYDTRIGDKITVKSIDFRFRATFNRDHFTGEYGDLAVWIILDKSPNGVGCKWTDIFHGQTCTTLSQKHMKNENRFQILKTFQMPCIGNTATEIQINPKFFYYKYKKPTQIKYQSSQAVNDPASIVDIVENCIYVVATCNGASTKVDHTREGPWTVHASMNVRYYDS